MPRRGGERRRDRHAAHRLRQGRRLRGRLPRRDPLDHPRGADRGHHAWHPALRRAAGRPRSPEHASVHAGRRTRGRCRSPGRDGAPRGGPANRGRAHPRRSRQRPAQPRLAALRRRGARGRHHALATSAGARVGAVPRPRHLRPGAAHLAAGAEQADAGDPLDPETLALVELPEPRSENGVVLAHCLVVDRFGNVGLNLDHEELTGTGITLGGTVEIEVSGERYLATYAQTFADVTAGELLVYEDAYRTLAVAINRGDAAATLGVRPDAEVRLRPR